MIVRYFKRNHKRAKTNFTYGHDFVVVDARTLTFITAIGTVSDSVTSSRVQDTFFAVVAWESTLHASTRYTRGCGRCNLQQQCSLVALK